MIKKIFWFALLSFFCILGLVYSLTGFYNPTVKLLGGVTLILISAMVAMAGQFSVEVKKE